MNPYATPKPVEERNQRIRRFRVLVSLLAIFVAYLIVAELVPQLVISVRERRFQNPISGGLGFLVVGLVGHATYAEWRGPLRGLRWVIVSCAVLLAMSVYITARFIYYFVPILSIDWSLQNYGVVLGQLFCVVIWIYFVNVLIRHRIMRH